MCSYLVCGASGSGKTYLASRLSCLSGKKIYTVDCKGDDFECGGSGVEVVPISLEKVLKVPAGSCVVVDDISRPSPSQVSVLRRLLVYTKRSVAQ